MTDTTNTDNLPALDALAGKINAEHKGVCDAAVTATQHAINCGVLLIEAKRGLPHGQWLPWIKENCDLSERTTQAYMRLARRHEELGGEEAQRVADLPVRQAMVAIADHQAEQTRGEPSSKDDLWAWAGRQVNGPFNRFDFDALGGGDSKLILNKLLSQTNVPTVASFCLSQTDKDIPMLRLVPWGELSDALSKLAPIAKGNIAGLDIDWTDFGAPPRAKKLPNEAAFVVGLLTVDAQWLCGGLLNEIDYRCKTYRDLSDDEYADRYGSEYDEILEAFQADCQRRLEDLKCTSAEGRHAHI